MYIVYSRKFRKAQLISNLRIITWWNKFFANPITNTGQISWGLYFHPLEQVVKLAKNFSYQKFSTVANNFYSVRTGVGISIA